MDVRVGISQSPQIIEVEMADNVDRDELIGQINDVIDSGQVLWLTDKRGKQTAIAGSKIAFVEVGVASDDRRIGFGA